MSLLSGIFAKNMKLSSSQIADLSHFLNAQPNLPVSIEEIARLLKEGKIIKPKKTK